MKFRAVHLLTNPKDPREQRSIAEVSALIRHGVEYFSIINPVYDGELPPAREANDRGFDLKPAHYGCWLAHSGAILNYNGFYEGIDGLLVFECDALFVESPENFYWRAVRALEACEQGNLVCFTFGPKHASKTVDTVGDDVIVISQFIETHAYLIPAKSLALFSDIFAKPWDAVDYVYTIYLYDRANERIGTFKHRAMSVQGDGVSLIDGRAKQSESHWRFKRYDQ